MDATYAAEDEYRRGRDLLGNDQHDEALECFRSAHNLDRANPRYRSFYGLGLALVEERHQRRIIRPPMPDTGDPFVNRRRLPIGARGHVTEAQLIMR